MSQTNGVNGTSHQGTLRLEEPVEIRIPVPWGHISAKAWGNPESKNPILAFHGWMDNAGSFDRLIPYLSNSLYFVAVEFPGHGLSSHMPLGIPYHFGDFLISIRRVAKYLKWSKFSIVGHSMGAGLAAYYSSIFPDSVDRLVMLDIVKPMTSADGPTPEGMASAIETHLSLEDKIKPELTPSYSYEGALERLRAATENSLTVDAAKSLMARGAVRTDEDKYRFRRDVRLRGPSLYPYSHEIGLNVLKGIKCQLLIIKAIDAPQFGGPQELIDKTLALYKEKCASFQYVEVEGNHFVHINEPEKISEMVNQFLIGTPIIKSGL